MSKKIIIGLIGLALILIAGFGMLGCGQTENLTALSITNFAHENGYEWKHKYTVIEGTLESNTFNIIRRLDGETTLSNGIIAQNFVVSYEANPTGSTANGMVRAFGFPFTSSFYYVCKTGVYSYGFVTRPTTEATLVLPLPLETGKVWTTSDGTFKAIGEEEITVPGGTFEAIKVTFTFHGNSEPYIYEWYADGVGLVKSYTLFLYADKNGQVGEGAIIEELLSKNF